MSYLSSYMFIFIKTSLFDSRAVSILDLQHRHFEILSLELPNLFNYESPFCHSKKSLFPLRKYYIIFKNLKITNFCVYIIVFIEKKGNVHQATSNHISTQKRALKPY